MDGTKNNKNFFDMDWKNFEQFFGGKVPFVENLSSGGEPMAWVESYVKNVLKQALPNMEAPSLKHHFHTELFETHNNVIVKVHVPDKGQARKLRVLVNVSQVKLEGLPDKNTQTIRLASLVVPDSCKAVYRNGILQLHIRKQSVDNPFQEIDIRFM